jgi:hypothetical protein
MEDAAYTVEELARVGDSLPTRGPVCPKCKQHIPRFVLKPEEAYRIRVHLRRGEKTLAMYELKAATGCPIAWAKLWVLHEGRVAAQGTTVPCPNCGKSLATALAKQCPHCFMDWHHPDRPRNLREHPWVRRGHSRGEW